MNLLASSRDDPRVLFVVNEDKILVYRFSTLTPSGLPIFVERISDPRGTDEDSTDRTINVMQVGYLGTEEVLVTANEAREVCVWFTQNLRRDPLLLSVSESAWGIAIHAARRMIAISTNAHTVTVFHCGTNSRISSRHHSAAAAAAATATEESTTSQQILLGHGHNIPCVTFSPCGRFVATASVDRTCRTWRLSDGQQIQQKSLGPLWGWGVQFVPNDAWMTITRTEYRQIPKDHLRPGKLPGQNVRDSPLSTTAFSQRRLPPGRDHRMVRTRWYAGPIHDDTERLSGHNHSGGASRSRPVGQVGQENEEMDDRDAALFGMDDDEDDEWEDTSSSEMDELDGQDEHDNESQPQPATRRAVGGLDNGSGSSTNPPPTTRLRPSIPRLSSVEVSIDTGDDGDNEGTGMDTEDAAGTAGESSSAASTTGRDRKLERRSLLSMKAMEVQRPHDHGESSSEQEHTTCEVPGTRLEAPSEPINIELDPVEYQPITTSTRQNAGPFKNLVRIRPFQKSKDADMSSTAATSQPVPELPTELLLCATARNIYLLGQHPLASEEAAEDTTISATSTTMPYATEVTSINILDEADEDGDDEMALTGEGATFGVWYVEQEAQSQGDDEMGHHHGQGHPDDYDDDESDDSDDSDDPDQSESDESMDSYVNHGSGPRSVSGIGSLNTLTVARSAATRADGRRYHHLEHFDRLFVMELVPELSLLIAASQKGTVTVFRLLRVLDDPIPPAASAAASGMGSAPGAGASSPSSSAHLLKPSDSTAATHHKAKRHKGKDIAGGKGKERKLDKDSSAKDRSPRNNNTITIKGVKYVLFPEMYLPRLEPSPFPLYGVSIVPLQQSTTTATLSSSSSAAATKTNSRTRSARRAGPSPSSTFMLHLMYMDSQLYSYEIRLRSDKDDPVGHGNIFV
ncbi:hypothetical protein BGX23_007224 [Mortierella sp. AD031]|nr:hypothetical protein BGX23_007224 [Mortierella sp. AD031]